MPKENRKLSARRAIESLRNGVPSRDAVTLLGCNQPGVEEKFSSLLDDVDNAATALGMLVSGEFGAGKSHLLVHLENLALSRGFVCSKVTISKETPFYDLGKVFKSAVDNGSMYNRKGRLIEELGQALKPNSDPYAAFFQWVNLAANNDLISPMFPASLMVHERSNDIELNNNIEYWWAGERIKVSEIKDGLKKVGQYKNYSFSAPKAAILPPQRLRFVTELIKGAGYRGWVVLLDEIELVGSYSVLQRGRSYAEVSRWMGQAAGQEYPGLVVVGTVTEDFASSNISPDGDKRDWTLLPPRLEVSRYKADAPRAETGMRLLERECTTLKTPSNDDVTNAIEKLRGMYSEAYGWDAPSLGITAGGAGLLRQMRYKVRAAINEWDLLRLFPDSSPATEINPFRFGYKEDTDLEKASKEEAAEDG